ncbi:acyl CoA:acetate/3-ketoacid CoA transferase [Sinorhizobium medicae]|uniref:acyl CoA:acetate/3-ketoacid CoA transferase n=1 Tax=Sinorhizobium medicae TaxID=110321 RepID=UPI001294FCF3|nr:CoA-transferase [Sinorhizobium medicae]MQX77593.1 acyl CoA:acetate/3-ketoacid CoA transferase [Sinorhizobium medicae]
MRNKIISAADAVAMIRPGDTVATSGFVGIGTPNAVICAIEKRFLELGEPRNLTLVFAAAPGDGKGEGLDRLAHNGLLKRVVGGHFGLVPNLARRALSGECEAYNLPLGCVSHLFREIAGGKPWMMSKAGLRTFVDPRNGGGKINSTTTEDLVELMEIDGEEWLRYKSFPINVAILRGTTADPLGNITMENEALTLDNLSLATAAKNCGGFVIVQVESIADGWLNPHAVKIPGALVDFVVVAGAKHHAQTYATQYNGAFSGEFRAPPDHAASMELNERKIIARRCAFELRKGDVVNLGIGMPEGVAAVATEEKIITSVSLTAEAGTIGGIPQGGLDFGAAVNPESIIGQNQMFDLIDGGGLDLACLSFAQVDAQGNVNVSHFADRLAGAGGFINISQNARRLVFCGTFTDRLQTEIRDGKLAILHEGPRAKFIEEVEQITFSGEYAREGHQTVLYVTERCVFSLTAEGLELTEVAPGIDIERDILAHMKFRPIIHKPREMAAVIFTEGPMNLDKLLFKRPLSECMEFDAERNTLSLSLVGYSVQTSAHVEAVREAVFALYERLGHRFSAVINYDGIDIASNHSDAWFTMAAEVERRCYDHVSRYTASAFLRLKLGAALTERDVVPHVFESQHEAAGYLLDATHRPHVPSGAPGTHRLRRCQPCPHRRPRISRR